MSERVFRTTDGETVRKAASDMTTKSDGTKARTVTCDECKGSGKVDGKKCDYCDGLGKYRLVEKVKEPGSGGEDDETTHADADEGAVLAGKSAAFVAAYRAVRKNDAAELEAALAGKSAAYCEAYRAGFERNRREVALRVADAKTGGSTNRQDGYTPQVSGIDPRYALARQSRARMLANLREALPVAAREDDALRAENAQRYLGALSAEERERQHMADAAGVGDRLQQARATSSASRQKMLDSLRAATPHDAEQEHIDAALLERHRQAFPVDHSDGDRDPQQVLDAAQAKAAEGREKMLRQLHGKGE